MAENVDSVKMIMHGIITPIHGLENVIMVELLKTL